MRTSEFERFTPGLKYEYISSSSDIWRDRRAGLAVTGAVVIGAAKCGSAPASPRAIATRTSSSAVGGSVRCSACRLRPDRDSRLRRHQAAEINDCCAARVVAMVDVPFGGYPGQGGHDRSCLRLAGDLDYLHRKNDRAVADPAPASRGTPQNQRC